MVQFYVILQLMTCIVPKLYRRKEKGYADKEKTKRSALAGADAGGHRGSYYGPCISGSQAAKAGAEQREINDYKGEKGEVEDSQCQIKGYQENRMDSEQKRKEGSVMYKKNQDFNHAQGKEKRHG